MMHPLWWIIEQNQRIPGTTVPCCMTSGVTCAVLLGGVVARDPEGKLVFPHTHRDWWWQRNYGSENQIHIQNTCLFWEHKSLPLSRWMAFCIFCMARGTRMVTSKNAGCHVRRQLLTGRSSTGPNSAERSLLGSPCIASLQMSCHFVWQRCDLGKMAPDPTGLCPPRLLASPVEKLSGRHSHCLQASSEPDPSPPCSILPCTYSSAFQPAHPMSLTIWLTQRPWLINQQRALSLLCFHLE